jgi:hypothetical protein
VANRTNTFAVVVPVFPSTTGAAAIVTAGRGSSLSAMVIVAVAITAPLRVAVTMMVSPLSGTRSPLIRNVTFFSV